MYGFELAVAGRLDAAFEQRVVDVLGTMGVVVRERIVTSPQGRYAWARLRAREGERPTLALRAYREHDTEMVTVDVRGPRHPAHGLMLAQQLCRPNSFLVRRRHVRPCWRGRRPRGLASSASAARHIPWLTSTEHPTTSLVEVGRGDGPMLAREVERGGFDASFVVHGARSAWVVGRVWALRPQQLFL